MALGLGLGTSKSGVGFTIDPSTLSGRELDLDSELGITLVSGKVDVWADQSGNGNDFTPPAGINRPDYNVSSVIGDNVVTFDGTNDFINITANFTIRTLYVVFRNITHPNLFSGVVTSTNGSGVYNVGQNILNTGANINALSAISSLRQGGASNFPTQAKAYALHTFLDTSWTSLQLAKDRNEATRLGNMEMRRLLIFSTDHDENTRTGILNFLNKTYKI